MRFARALVLSAVVSLAVENAVACAVDAMQTKTDTTITIGWDLSSCNNVNTGQSFRICWKQAGNGGNACIPPTLEGSGLSGTKTITGLAPATAYKIKTYWQKNSNWKHVTTRTVTTNPSPSAASAVFRYEKGTGSPYCVVVYWKNPPPLDPANPLKVHFKKRALGVWTTKELVDAEDGTPNSATNEYALQRCGFYVSVHYRANLVQGATAVSNVVQWH